MHVIIQCLAADLWSLMKKIIRENFVHCDERPWPLWEGHVAEKVVFKLLNGWERYTIIKEVDISVEH